MRGLLAMVIACAPGPDFTTTQGVGVYVQRGVGGVTRNTASKAVAICIGEATARKPEEESRVHLDSLVLDFRAASSIAMRNGQLVHGYDEGGTIEIAALADSCPFSVLSHEWGHVVAAVFGDGDPGHTDPSLFNTPDSLEMVAKGRIRESVCSVVP